MPSVPFYFVSIDPCSAAIALPPPPVWSKLHGTLRPFGIRPSQNDSLSDNHPHPVGFPPVHCCPGHDQHGVGAADAWVAEDCFRLATHDVQREWLFRVITLSLQLLLVVSLSVQQFGWLSLGVSYSLWLFGWLSLLFFPFLFGCFLLSYVRLFCYSPISVMTEFVNAGGLTATWCSLLLLSCHLSFMVLTFHVRGPW